MSGWDDIANWMRTAVTAMGDVIHNAEPVVPLTPVAGASPSADPALQKRYGMMAALIMRERGTFGPSPRTGGFIPMLPDSEVGSIAKQLVDGADAGLSGDGALIAAWASGESKFSPLAVNPNHQDAKPGETPEQALLHMDVGIGQFDGAELLAMLPGLTIEEALAKAKDPTWAIPQMCKLIEGLLEWAVVVDSQLRDAGVSPTYGDDYHIIAFEAYNVGKTGALARALKAQDAAAAFVLHAGGGAVVALADATDADRAFHAKVMAETKDGTFGYGTALNTRWEQFIVELGQVG